MNGYVRQPSDFVLWKSPEPEGAAAEDAVEAEYQDQGSSGSGEDPVYDYDGDDYSYGDYKA